MNFKTWIPLLLLTVTATVAFQNYGSEHFKFFIWDFSTSKAVVILISMIFGVIIGRITSRG